MIQNNMQKINEKFMSSKRTFNESTTCELSRRCNSGYLINTFSLKITRSIPVAPNGWPKDNDPPHKFNLSMGISPNFLSNLVWF